MSSIVSSPSRNSIGQLSMKSSRSSNISRPLSPKTFSNTQVSHLSQSADNNSASASATKKDNQNKNFKKTSPKSKMNRTSNNNRTIRKRRSKRLSNRKAFPSFHIYIYRVLKETHPDLRISKSAMEVMNHYMNDMFEKLALEAKSLMRRSNRATMSHRDINGAVKLLLPGQLAVVGNNVATKSLYNFT